jgi:hypothetical protein
MKTKPSSAPSWTVVYRVTSAAGAFRLSISAIRALCRIPDRFSDKSRTSKLRNSHTIHTIKTHYHTIILPVNSPLTPVLSEAYDYFCRNLRKKFSIVTLGLAVWPADRVRISAAYLIRREPFSPTFNRNQAASVAEVRLDKRITQVTTKAPLQTPDRFLKARQGNLCFCSDAMTARPTSLKLVSAFSPAKEGRLHV